MIGPAYAQSPANWATYTNVRYAFAVDYPRDVFTSFAESGNSDGATFETKQPGVEMRAFGFLNADKQSPAAVLAERYKDRKPSLKLVKRDGFIVSGTQQVPGRPNVIFYDRCTFKADRVACLVLIYPASLKTAWDAAVARMSKSLRTLQAGGAR